MVVTFVDPRKKKKARLPRGLRMISLFSRQVDTEMP